MAGVMDTTFPVPSLHLKSEAGMNQRQLRPGISPVLGDEAGMRATSQGFQRAQRPWWSANPFPGEQAATWGSEV